MAAVTYLFGAGASCECLPLIKNVPDRLEIFRVLIDGYNPGDLHAEFRQPGQTKASIKNEINSALIDLIAKVKLHASIDTYAKKLALTQNPNYIILKILLSFSFIYDQMIIPPDRRYDAFFASIMTSDILTFLDIRILSWNYDYQFEKSFSEFRNEKSLKKIQHELNVIPFDANVRQSDRFSIFKLNGTTAFRNQSDVFNPLDDLWSTDRFLLIEKLFEYFAEFKRIGAKVTSMIGFAWEGNELSQLVVKEAKRDIEKTRAVVVIGYSFPFFNRDIDREIFANIKPDVKIYVQDINCEMVINNLISILPRDTELRYKPIPINIVEQKDKKDIVQFYLPAEL